MIVSILCLAFLLQPTVSSAYFMLSDLTVQLYLIMYCIMFISAIYLRYTHPEVIRGFRIPFGNFGMWIVAGVGFLTSFFAIIVGFFPPTQFSAMQINASVFVLFLASGILFVCGIPFIIYERMKGSK